MGCSGLYSCRIIFRKKRMAQNKSPDVWSGLEVLIADDLLSHPRWRIVIDGLSFFFAEQLCIL